ncbi:hypothetical protein QE152_g33730 [Popillia japonica]|uniref:HTH psq-type domain-containing protein n=1 Tax=Popillia japonica TaxID=7064 RepID=A0AAW1IWA6_POPJA
MSRIMKKKIHRQSKNIIKKARKKTATKTTRRKLYSQTALEEALMAIEKGDSFRKVSKAFKIPVSTLHRKSKNSDCTVKKSGPEPILSKEIEQLIVNWFLYRAERGHPVGKTDILDGVDWCGGYKYSFHRLPTRSTLVPSFFEAS